MALAWQTFALRRLCVLVLLFGSDGVCKVSLKKKREMNRWADNTHNLLGV
jgi:hypothetical protein